MYICKIDVEEMNREETEYIDDIEIKLELPTRKNGNSKYSCKEKLEIYNISGNKLYVVDNIGAVKSYFDENFLEYEFELLIPQIVTLSDRIVSCETEKGTIYSGKFKSASVPGGVMLDNEGKNTINFKVFDTFFRYNLKNDTIESTSEISNVSLAKFSHLFRKRISR